MIHWNIHPNGEVGVGREIGVEGYFVLHNDNWLVAIFEEGRKWERTFTEKCFSRKIAIDLITIHLHKF
jgi:hypothetical protein